MPGMLFLAFFATLLVLRATGARMTSGVALMAFGIWLLWNTATHHYYGFEYGFDGYDPPRLVSLLFGTWLVVKGALRASSY
jgi:hypothetical protein